MTKHNFIKVIAFIIFFLLCWAPASQDPVLYARMQTLEDEALDGVEADGVFVDFNITVRSVANQGVRIDNGEASSDYIDMAYVEIGNGVAGGNFGLASTMAWDVGSGSGQTWLLGGNIYLPTSAAGIGVIANAISYRIDGGASQVLGNLVASGLYLGQNVLAGTNSDLLPGGTPWLLISSSPTTGIQFEMELAAYLEQARLNYSTTGAGNYVALNGWYVFGMTNTPASGTPGTWGNLTGNAKLGGKGFQTWNANGTISATTVDTVSTMNIGSNGTGDNCSRIKLDIPLTLSIRIREFYLHSKSFGPMAVDGFVMYRNSVTFYSL